MTIARICLWIIRLVYRSKDRDLAELIHRTAGLYQTRPQDGWTCPEDWEATRER